MVDYKHGFEICDLKIGDASVKAGGAHPAYDFPDFPFFKLINNIAVLSRVIVKVLNFCI